MNSSKLVVRVGKAPGSQLYCRLKLLSRVFRLTHALKRETQIVVRSRKLRVLLNRLSISVGRFIQVAEPGQRGAEVVIRPWKVVAFGDGCAIGVDGFFEIAPSRERSAQSVAGFREHGLFGYSFARFGDCFVELSEGKHRAAQLEVRLREPSSALRDRGAHLFGAAFQVVLFQEHSAQLEVSIGVASLPLLDRLAKRGAA